MKSRRSSSRVRRGNPRLTEHFHDPYHSRVKRTEATRCPDCGVQYRQGRWVWPKTGSTGLRLVPCPACRRIVVSTTDVHLPHRIAHALRDAFGGTTETHYDREGYFTRVRWERDD